MSVFGKSYSGAYDSLYGAKDYKQECDLIERLLGNREALSFIDIGCGTGGHAIQLAKRGHQIIGVDRSADMLEIAQQKIQAAGQQSRIELMQGDARAFDAGRTVDVALMMFAVLGYQQTDKDVSDALATVARHLRPGGAFIFDIWFGPAVVADPPGARRRVIKTSEGRVARTTKSKMLPGNLCKVAFVLETYRGEKLAECVEEDHVMRYFFPEELKMFAAAAGFVCKRISDFNDLRRPAGSDSWNAIVLFQKW
jgi:ubiquinone/menaquinone biosynthesis C-methylase UbiE